ncbi:MAG: sigma-70 family RNA polymerase sigma factor [Bacteroidetes bacterium]|nr:sigma-70 family RNA polymerase sigma factor [Bacteroidota bacterium]
MTDKETVYQNIHQDIIDGCVIGDQKSQFKLYRLYFKAMYNASLRIVNDSTEAEDIMQDAFLAAFEKIDSYEGKVSFGAWLKKIVINKSLDYVRKKRVDLIPIEEQKYRIEYTNNTENDKVSEASIEDIKRCINQLANGYRIVLSLYLIEGYDHEEIGQILGISGSTSRSQFTRARKKLIEELKKK